MKNKFILAMFSILLILNSAFISTEELSVFDYCTQCQRTPGNPDLCQKICYTEWGGSGGYPYTVTCSCEGVPEEPGDPN